MSFSRRRLAIWGVLALVYIVSYFHRVAPAVLAKDLMGSFSATGSDVATMAALYLYAFAAMQFVVGAVVDGWGPRRAVAAVRAVAAFEGQAAMLLEGLAQRAGHASPLTGGWRIGADGVLDLMPLLAAMARGRTPRSSPSR